MTTVCLSWYVFEYFWCQVAIATLLQALDASIDLPHWLRPSWLRPSWTPGTFGDL